MFWTLKIAGGKAWRFTWRMGVGCVGCCKSGCLCCGHEAALWLGAPGLGRSLGQGTGTERQVSQVASPPTIPPPQVWEAETHTSGTPSTILESLDSCPHLTDEDPDSDLPKVT